MSFGFALLGAAIAFRWIPVKPGSFEQFVGWICLLFFGACTPFWAQMLFVTKPVLEIGPEGIPGSQSFLSGHSMGGYSIYRGL
jgi:hypothetical protein